VSMTMPMVLLEALNLGVPVFVRDLAVFRELKERGIVKTFTDTSDLVQKIGKMAKLQGQNSFVSNLPNSAAAAKIYLGNHASHQV
jgi:glycosyltransferase involved in cell wall biosynthesis